MRCSHVGHMTYGETVCSCSQCGTEWVLLFTKEDRPLGWRLVGPS